MRFRAMEGEDLAAARLGIEQVGKLGLDPGRLVQERQRPSVGREGVGQASAVALRLCLDAGEGPALLLGLDGARRGTIDIE